jgi:hypothetical protein
VGTPPRLNKTMDLTAVHQMDKEKMVAAKLELYGDRGFEIAWRQFKSFLNHTSFFLSRQQRNGNK